MTLKTLFGNYKEFEEIIKHKNDETIDLEDVELNPTLFLLLKFYCRNNNKILLNDERNLKFFNLPSSKFEQQNINFIDKVMDNLNTEYGGNFVLRHILSELTYNIHEHAFENNQKTDAAIAIQFQSENKLEISIMDNGLSIPGRFDKSNVSFTDDCNAIEKAINNFSTASENPYERGNGLWTTIRLVIEGNGGEILIISRNALLHITNEDYKYDLLDNGKFFNGTLISIRLNKFEVQNIYDLIELHKNNFYKYGG